MTFLQWLHWHLTGYSEIWHVLAWKLLFQILHSILELPAPSFMFPSLPVMCYSRVYYCAYTYTQTSRSVISWPLPVTRTLPVTWTCYTDSSSLTPRSLIYVPFPSRYVLLCLQHTQTPRSVISWPLPVTRTLPVTWPCYTDSSSSLQHHFTVDFLCLLCAYGRLMCHFSYLQRQWTFLFSLILLRALLWWSL